MNFWIIDGHIAVRARGALLVKKSNSRVVNGPRVPNFFWWTISIGAAVGPCLQPDLPTKIVDLTLQREHAFDQADDHRAELLILAPRDVRARTAFVLAPFCGSSLSHALWGGDINYTGLRSKKPARFHNKSRGDRRGSGETR